VPDADRVGGAHRDRDAGSDHAVGAEHADREVGNVHRAAAAAAVAGGLAEELLEHAGDVRPLGDRVSVAAVGGREVVARTQVRTHARRHRLLPGGQVQGATHGDAGVLLLAEGRDTALARDLRGVLERADAAHRAIEREQDRKSTRLNSSHVKISYAVFCLKKKKYISNY